MKYINNYADQAAYTADTVRATNDSTVSNIETMGVKYEGKNVLVSKLSAEFGDIAVFDKLDSVKKVIKRGHTMLLLFHLTWWFSVLYLIELVVKLW